MHGNVLKQIDGVPKLVNQVCNSINTQLSDGRYHPEHVAAAFYDPDHPIFTSPLYLSLLGITQNQDFLVSVDETCLNSPVMMSDQIALKIRKYKVKPI